MQMDQEVEVVPFGTWLVRQYNFPADWSHLARVANSDRSLPRDADPEAVRDHLKRRGADLDVLDMLEEAERAWIAASA